MKKRIYIMGIAALGLAWGVRYYVRAQPEKIPGISFAGKKVKLPEVDISKIDFRQIAQAIRIIPQIAKIVEGASPDLAGKLRFIHEPAMQISDLVEQMQKVSEDLQKAAAIGRNFPNMYSCIKATNVQRAGTTPAAEGCRKIGCSDRTRCIIEGVTSVRALLGPLVNDILLGYEEKGTHKESVLVNILQLIKQPQLIEKIKPAAEAVKNVDKLLEEIEKLIRSTHHLESGVRL